MWLQLKLAKRVSGDYLLSMTRPDNKNDIADLEIKASALLDLLAGEPVTVRGDTYEKTYDD
jgi:hypothetical protein